MVDELEPGAFVTASVRLVRPLAEGGMGKVWIAEHLVLDTWVVVKLMARELGGLAGAAARFAREAAVAAAVKSPHVVQVFDSGVTDAGVAFIVMELLEGHDLGRHLAARGRMSPHEVTTVVSQLAKALAKAHRVGVVHRDIKPDNVFLCDVEGGEPFVKLLDFGTAKDEARAPFATTLGQLIGTPYYMSPEQILGEEVDYRTDIWSLGVLAFEALTGARPFEGATVGAITLAIHTTKPRLTDLAPELPPALDDWFARACARDPADRFQSAKAAGEAFARAIAGEAPPHSLLPDSDPVLELTPSVPGPLPSNGYASSGSERVATSLSSTLASPRAERRTMTWIAGGVGLATIAAMIALLAHDEPRPTASTATANAGEAPASVAPAPSASASTPAPATAAPATPPPPSTAPAAAAGSETAASVWSVATGASGASGAPGASGARMKDAAPPASGASASASARPSSPRAPSPSSTSSPTSPPPLPRFPVPPPPPATAAPSDSPPALPADPEPPPPPLDLHDLLPPATPSQ